MDDGSQPLGVMHPVNAIQGDSQQAIALSTICSDNNHGASKGWAIAANQAAGEQFEPFTVFCEVPGGGGSDTRVVSTTE